MLYMVRFLELLKKSILQWFVKSLEPDVIASGFFARKSLPAAINGWTEGTVVTTTVPFLTQSTAARI